MTRTRYSYGGTPGTTERGARERARQDALIAAAGGITQYLQGARPRGGMDNIDDGVHVVVSYTQPMDTNGDKISA